MVVLEGEFPKSKKESTRTQRDPIALAEGAFGVGTLCPPPESLEDVNRRMRTE